MFFDKRKYIYKIHSGGPIQFLLDHHRRAFSKGVAAGRKQASQAFTCVDKLVMK